MDEEGHQPQSAQVPVDDNSQTVPDQPHSTADYSQYAPPPKPPSQWRRWLIWAGIILLVLAILAAGYKLLKKKPSTASTPSQTSQTQSPTSSVSITSATKNYASQNFALSFDYPADWTIADSGGGILTAKSPDMDLKNATGSSAKANIMFTIRNKTQKLTEFDAGSAVAERDSTKIAYTKPTQSQRGNTYVSFLRYAKSIAGLNEVCITGNSGYKTAQAIPLVDMQKVDPVICINFWVSGAQSAQPLTITSALWDDPNFSTPLLNIFKSLVIT